jgi:hypothetical protein
MTVTISSRRPRATRSSSRFPGRRCALLFLLVLCFAFSTRASAQQNSRNAAPPWADSTGESDVYPVGDGVGVYRAVLDLLYSDGRDHPGYIILVDTARRSAGGPCAWNPCTDKWPHKSEIDSSTIVAYARPSRKTPRIIDFGYKIPIKRVSTGEFERIMNDGYAELAAVPPEKLGGPSVFWAGFRHKYPKAWGYVMLSKVAFDTHHTEALIGVYQNCGESCRSTEAIFLKRAGNDWRVIERIPDQIEAYQTSGNLRYRGPAGEHADQSQIVAAGSPDAAPRPESDDAAKVYGAVLDRLYTFDGESPRSIVVSESRAIGAYLPEHRSRIDSSTAVNFSIYGRLREAFSSRFRFRLAISWISDTALKELEQVGAPLAKKTLNDFEKEQSPLFLGFAAKYPGTWGYVSLTRVAFNPEHTQALVYSRHFCGDRCENADVWFLERKNDNWYIVERMDAGGAIDSHGFHGLRYLGPELAQSFYRPGRVHGVVTELETGRPLSRVQLEVRHRDQSFFVDTDDEGRYSITNLPPNGAVLSVRCPPKSPTKSAMAAILQNTRGIDSTMNVQVTYAECAQQ